MIKLAKNRDCTGCLACRDACPKKAIITYYDKDGHKMVRISEDSCIQCHKCESVCPIISKNPNGSYDLNSGYYAGWSKIAQIRKNGATSGIGGTLAYDFIRKGGLVASACMDGTKCIYRLIDNTEDLKYIQGSKYTYSDTNGIFKDILEALKNKNKVLFIGLPCHAGGLLNFIPSTYRNDLFVVDLICGGVSSPALIDRFINYKDNDITNIISFRNKDNGWKPLGFRYSLKYRDRDGNIIEDLGNKRNLITDGFACGLTNRYSCYDCKFSYPHRRTDITIGDLWKDKDFQEEHHNGVSSLIVHNEKGLNLLYNAPIELKPIKPQKVLLPNHRIYNGKSLKSIFPERLIFHKVIKKSQYNTLLKIYASDLRPLKLTWIIFAIYRILSFNIEKQYNKWINYKILNKIKKNK